MVIYHYHFWHERAFKMNNDRAALQMNHVIDNGIELYYINI